MSSDCLHADLRYMKGINCRLATAPLLLDGIVEKPRASFASEDSSNKSNVVWPERAQIIRTARPMNEMRGFVAHRDLLTCPP